MVTALKSNSPSIRDHINDTDHSISLENFCIIDKGDKELDLFIQESLLVLRDRPTLNFQSFASPLGPIVTYSLPVQFTVCLP